MTRMPKSPKPQRAPKVTKTARTKAEQRAETLERMLDAAELLFSKHGLYGVTLRDVALEVGVHTSLMHYYFEDKLATRPRKLHYSGVGTADEFARWFNDPELPIVELAPRPAAGATTTLGNVSFAGIAGALAGVA